MNLREIIVRPVRSAEQQRYKELMGEHHYLGFLPKIGETLWYLAACRHQWVALLSFSAAALKCAARDRWIGWDFRHQYARLKLVVNNSRFLILPNGRVPNSGSRILSLCQWRLGADWQATFGHPVLLLETFVDPQRFGCRYYKGRFLVPSQSTIRDVLIRVDPVQLDRALQRWNEAYAGCDESLAIDGKTMCNAIDEQGHQTHIMSAVGHQTKICHTQKK